MSTLSDVLGSMPPSGDPRELRLNGVAVLGALVCLCVFEEVWGWNSAVHCMCLYAHKCVCMCAREQECTEL